jgi:hypothetical protein
MTDTLIDGLHGKVANRDGLITFGELGLYVQQAVASESGKTQIPQFGHLRGSQGGDFIFYQEAGPRLPITLQTGLSSERAAIRQGVVSSLMDMARGSDPTQVDLARMHLEKISQTDPDPRVRDLALSFFGKDATKESAPTSLDLSLTAPTRKTPPPPLTVDSDITRVGATTRGVPPERSGDAKSGSEVKTPPRKKVNWMLVGGIILLAALLIGAIIILTVVLPKLGG